MKTSEFRIIIQTLFGSGSQSELARRLGISSRTVRRWVSGDRPIPVWVSIILNQWLSDLEDKTNEPS